MGCWLILSGACASEPRNTAPGGVTAGTAGALSADAAGAPSAADPDITLPEAGSGGATEIAGAAGWAGGDAAAGAATTGGGGTGGTANMSTAGSGGGSGAGGRDAGPLIAVTVYLAGDSTVSKYADTASPNDQAGWGQMLHENVNRLVTVDNRAVGGRTARRFIEEGYLGEVLARITPGDYLLVQFGTNDSNKTATYTFNGQTIPYYLDPATDFKAHLRKYIQGARDRQATPVLVTPPPRNSAYCTGGNGTGNYAAAMIELGQSESVAVVNLNAKAVAHLKAICPSPVPENFFLLKKDGGVDGTHFQERGARILAGFVANGIREAKLPLARYLE